MEKKSRKLNSTKSLVTKENKIIHKCYVCGNTLTQYEVSDNLFAGVNIKNYVCYGCQPEIEEETEDDNFGYPDYDENEYNW